MKKSTSKFTDSDKLSILREYYASGCTQLQKSMRLAGNEPDEISRLQARIKDLEKKRIQMLSGKYIFAQLIEFLPQNYFQRLVMKYKGNKSVKHFTC